MSTQSNIHTGPTAGPSAPSTASAIRPLLWSVRRELWEHRSVYIAPLAAAGIVLFGLLILAIRLSHHLNIQGQFDMSGDGGMLAMPFDFAAIPVMLTSLIVAVFYCLGALHNERRDRSILFWKSLPVSDLTAVIAKAIVPLVVLPVATFVIICALHLFMLLMGTATLLAHGMNPSVFWTRVPWLEVEVTLLYGLTTTSLWYAPVYGWLLLVSAWAKRAPFLWAVLPPLAICVLEKIAFDTGNFASVLQYRLHGGFTDAFDVGGGHAMHHMPTMDPVQFVSAPGLWVGLAFAAAFLAASVWLRRYREPV